MTGRLGSEAYECVDPVVEDAVYELIASARLSACGRGPLVACSQTLPQKLNRNLPIEFEDLGFFFFGRLHRTLLFVQNLRVAVR